MHQTHCRALYLALLAVYVHSACAIFAAPTLNTTNVTTPVPKPSLSDAAGNALSAAQATAAALSAKASAAGASVAKFYPGADYAGCIRTADQYEAAYQAGTTACVAPWLYGRVPDTTTDPVWAAGAPAPPADVKYIKGPRAGLAFVFGSDTLEGILTARAACGASCPPNDIVSRVLGMIGIDVATYGFPSGTRVPLKVFGSDATVYERTNKAVQLSYAFYPDTFDRITRTHKLNPRLLGTQALRALQSAYSQQTGGDPTVSFTAVTGCTPSTGLSGTCPDLNDPTHATAPGCKRYYAALAPFCVTDASGKRVQNYDSAACASMLASQPVDGQGSVSALVARAFVAACYDFSVFNSANGFSWAGPPANPPYTVREYLVNGDRLLSQTGGSTIIWLALSF